VEGPAIDTERSGSVVEGLLFTSTLVVAGTEKLCAVFWSDQSAVTVAVLFKNVPLFAVTSPMIVTVQVSPCPGIDPALHVTSWLLKVQKPRELDRTTFVKPVSWSDKPTFVTCGSEFVVTIVYVRLEPDATGFDDAVIVTPIGVGLAPAVCAVTTDGRTAVKITALSPATVRLASRVRGGGALNPEVLRPRRTPNKDVRGRAC
jgi:hypothetical protein